MTPSTALDLVSYRSYLDGKHLKTTKTGLDQAVRWMNNTQAEWSKNLGPLVQPGEFDPNNGHQITRVSELELLVTTTGNRKLRWVIVPAVLKVQ